MPYKRTIKTGDRFNRWTVLREDPERAKNRKIRWICRCDCGAEQPVVGANLRNGHSQSCGCRRVDVTGIPYRSHGLSFKIPEYRVWQGMRTRCSNPNERNFFRYGGRGITVCPEWASFEVFLADMGRRPSIAHSIERIDNDGPYAPWNCRWATSSEQSRNQRRTRIVTFDGLTLPLIEWAEKTGISLGTLGWRLKHGWSVELALTTPTQEQYRNRHAGHR